MSDPAHPPSPTYCVIPWTHVFADEQGQMRPCCMAIGDRSRANTDADGRPHEVGRPGGITDGWNSAFMRDLRHDMLAGRRPDVCTQCFSEEDLGIRSYRQDANVTLGAHITGALAATAPDGTVPTTAIRSADFRLGNQCNLRCRMCSPMSSKLLIPEWRTMFGLADDDPRMTALERINWFDSDAFWDNCVALIPQLEKLHFAGGEPLIIPRALDFLAQVIAAGRAQDIVLSYVTNLTTLPDRVTTLWPAFREVKLVVSLDGYDALNTFIRFPANWQRIDTHLRALIERSADYNCTKITVNTTVQAYNVLHLAELFEYLFARTAPNVVPYPRLTLLSWPSALSVCVLPADIKALAAERLRAFVDRWNGRWPVEGAELERFTSAIDGIITHMRGSDTSSELPEFVRRTRAFDAARGQDIRVILPEFAPLFDELPRTAGA